MKVSLWLSPLQQLFIVFEILFSSPISSYSFSFPLCFLAFHHLFAFLLPHFLDCTVHNVFSVSVKATFLALLNKQEKCLHVLLQSIYFSAVWHYGFCSGPNPVRTPEPPLQGCCPANSLSGIIMYYSQGFSFALCTEFDCIFSKCITILFGLFWILSWHQNAGNFLQLLVASRCNKYIPFSVR